MRVFDVAPNFPFTTGEMMGDYYLQTCNIKVASRVAKQLKTYDLKKLENTGKVPKLHRMMALWPGLLPKQKFC